MGITSGSQNLEDTVISGEGGDVESSTAKITDDGSGGRLVDDAEDPKTSNGTGILGGLTLSFIETDGNGDDGTSNPPSKVNLSNLLHLG